MLSLHHSFYGYFNLDVQGSNEVNKTSTDSVPQLVSKTSHPSLLDDLKVSL